MSEESRAPNETSTAFFGELPIDDAVKLVEESLPEEAAVNALFIKGDHWQDGEGWIGPLPPTDDSDYDTTLALIETGFTSRNVVKEIVQRHTRGVVGREPVLGVILRVSVDHETEMEEAAKKRKKEIEDALTEWWDSRQVHSVIKRAVMNSTWSTRGPLRLYIPRGKLVATGGIIPKQPDLATALRLIHIEAPDPDQCAVIVDEDSRDEAGILVTEVDGKPAIEMVFLGEETTSPDEPRQTIIRIASEAKDDEFPMDLSGMLTMFQIDRPLVITTQMQQMQRALNLCLSMVPRNIVTAGFLERIILNGLPPGHWETDSRGKRTRFVREAYNTGPGSTSWVRGLELPQKDGSVQLTNPSVAWHDPVDPKPANDAKRSIYQDMLEEADQAHVLIQGDATASGKSREEARSDYELSLRDTETPTNFVGRRIIETVIAMADAFMGTPGTTLEEWRGQFQCRLISGRLSIEERKQVIDEAEKNMRARETAMAEIGIDDVGGELSRIAQQPDHQLSVIDSQADVLVKLTTAGADFEAAAELVGIENAADLVATDLEGSDPNAELDSEGNPIPKDNPDDLPPTE